MAEGERYLVCGCTPWAREIFERRLRHLPGEWDYADDPRSLYLYPNALDGTRYAFFLHWRWTVPAEVLKATECIGFHVGVLPLERGGSPFQWRILEGDPFGFLTMFRMTEAVDAGPIYADVGMMLDGPAEALYRRAMAHAADLIAAFLEAPSEPVPQDEARARVYPRRRPEESDLALAPLEGEAALDAVYDRIRCVDAPGYPLAFVDVGRLRFTFRRAVHYGDRVEVDCVIRVRPDRQGEAG